MGLFRFGILSCGRLGMVLYRGVGMEGGDVRDCLDRW